VTRAASLDLLPDHRRLALAVLRQLIVGERVRLPGTTPAGGSWGFGDGG
jgi:hypothetical protein